MTCHCSTPVAPASLNMARLKEATPHASAALTSAAINTSQKSMKSHPSYEIPALDRAHGGLLEKCIQVDLSRVVSEREGNVRGGAIYTVHLRCELLHSRNVRRSKYAVHPLHSNTEGSINMSLLLFGCLGDDSVLWYNRRSDAEERIPWCKVAKKHNSVFVWHLCLISAWMRHLIHAHIWTEETKSMMHWTSNQCSQVTARRGFGFHALVIVCDSNRGWLAHCFFMSEDLWTLLWLGHAHTHSQSHSHHKVSTLPSLFTIDIQNVKSLSGKNRKRRISESFSNLSHPLKTIRFPCQSRKLPSKLWATAA